MLWLMHYSIRDFMHNLAVTVVVSEIFYTQADLCIIILCIMRMSTVLEKNTGEDRWQIILIKKLVNNS